MSTEKTLTVDRIMSWKPCGEYHARQRVEELFVGRESLTARDIIELDIPHSDKTWVLLRPYFLDRHQMSELAGDFAGHVADLYDDAAGEAWYHWKASAAFWAARAAAGDAFCALNAVRAGRAAVSAAWVAGANGANAVESDAAWDARDAERRWQLERIVHYVGNHS